MAIFNEIFAGRYPRAIQKLFATKGSTPVRALGGDLMVTLPLFYGVEMRYLESWDRYGDAIQVVGSPANTSQVEFRNPAGSNVIAVFEKLTICNTTVNAVQFALGHSTTGADLATPVTPTNPRLDARGRPASTVIESKGNPAAASGNTFQQGQVLANDTKDFIFFEDQEIALLPGDALFLEVLTANITMFVTAMWRERILEESEQK